MEDSILKKFISIIRNQLESAKDRELKVIDVDATTSNFDEDTENPKIPALGEAVEEAVANPVQRPNPVSVHLLRR